MEKDELYNLIGKKLADDILADEAARLKELLKNPVNMEAYEELKKSWDDASKFKPTFNPAPEDTWENFQQSIDKRGRKLQVLPIFYKVAALVVLAVGLGYFTLKDKSGPNLITYSTGVNERVEVVLADNSIVWLNEQSKLTVPEKFDADARNVELEGEAFFDVSRDETRPFFIRNTETQVQVLGTSFNVRAYKEEELVEVNVATGKVALSEIGNIDNKILLERGMRGVFAKQTDMLQAFSIQSSNFLAWQTQTLTFSDAELSQVVNDLMEYFKVEVSLANTALATCRFTSTFKNPTLEEVLEVLEVTLDVTYKKIDSKYLLEGRGCSN